MGVWVKGEYGNKYLCLFLLFIGRIVSLTFSQLEIFNLNMRSNLEGKKVQYKAKMEMPAR